MKIGVSIGSKLGLDENRLFSKDAILLLFPKYGKFPKHMKSFKTWTEKYSKIPYTLKTRVFNNSKTGLKNQKRIKIGVSIGSKLGLTKISSRKIQLFPEYRTFPRYMKNVYMCNEKYSKITNTSTLKHRFFK